jgi:hypothetical protein
VKAIQTDGEYLADLQRMDNISQEVDEVVTITECQWLKIREFVKIESKLSVFIGKKGVKTNEILSAIQNDKFFGLCKVKISTPIEIIKKYECLNFPFIFDRKEISSDMLDPKMREITKINGVNFPYSTTTLCYNSDERILATPLIKFYLSLGMVVEHMYYALEFIKAKPFTNFVRELVNIRVKSVGVNSAMGDRAKLTLNSSIGKFGLNLQKHRKVSFSLAKNLNRHTRTALLENEHALISEFPTNVHEVCKKKRTIVDTIPVHVSMYVYQQSKLKIYKFLIDLFDHLIPYEYEICYMGQG